MSPAVIGAGALAALVALVAAALVMHRRSGADWLAVGRSLGLTQRALESSALGPEVVLEGSLESAPVTIRRQGEVFVLSTPISPPLGPGLMLTWRGLTLRGEVLGIGRRPEVRAELPPDVSASAADPEGARAVLSSAVVASITELAQALEPTLERLVVDDDAITMLMSGAPDPERFRHAARRARQLGDRLKEASKAARLASWRESLPTHWLAAGVPLDASLAGRHRDRAFTVDLGAATEVVVRMRLDGRAPPEGWRLLAKDHAMLATGMSWALGEVRMVELGVPRAAPLVSIAPQGVRAPALSGGLIEALAPLPEGLLGVRGAGPSELALTISMDAARAQLPLWLDAAAELATVLERSAEPKSA